MSAGRFSPEVLLLRAAGVFGENQLSNAVEPGTLSVFPLAS